MFFLHFLYIYLAAEVTNGAIVKISLSKLHVDLGDENLTDNVTLWDRFAREAIATPACEDKRELSASSGYITIPNNVREKIHPGARFYRSPSVESNIQNVLDREVDGLVGVMVRSVLSLLTGQGCYTFIFGGVVRDMFLNATPKDVDVEVGCNTSMVFNVCNESYGHYGNDVCSLSSRGIAHIGKTIAGSDNKLDLASVKGIFSSLEALEYTANSLAIDINGIPNVILDIPYYGVEDVCNKHIRIPAPNWSLWLIKDGQKNYKHLYRYWKLRTKGFTAVSVATKMWVVNQTKGAIDSDNGTGFQDFYCKQVFGAKGIKDSACIYGDDLPSTCFSSSTMEKMSIYNNALVSDFGNKYWSDTLSLIIPECEG